MPGLVVVWAAAQEQPWVVVSDVPPARMGVCWYGLRVWIELGFRTFKGVGWPWPCSGCWHTAPALKMPPSRGCHRHGCERGLAAGLTAPAWVTDNAWSAAFGWD
jgi:hypothetical protein